MFSQEPMNPANCGVVPIECTTRLEHPHEQLPPFVEVTMCGEAGDVAADSNYTVESAASDIDAPVVSLLLPVPLDGPESSAQRPSEASPRNLSACVYPIVSGAGHSIVRLDEDQHKHEVNTRDIVAGSRAGDPGENGVISASSPRPPYGIETDIFRLDFVEDVDTARRCGSPDQELPDPRRDEGLPATTSIGTFAKSDIDSVIAAECAITVAFPPNDPTLVHHDEVHLDELQLFINNPWEPPIPPQNVIPAPPGDAERRSDSGGCEFTACSATIQDAGGRDGHEQIIRSDNPDEDGSSIIHREDVPTCTHSMFNSTHDPDGHTSEDMSAPSVVPTLSFDSLSSRTDSSIAPSSPRSELGISAQFSDVGDDTRSEVSAASQIPAAPSSPRSVNNEDFFTPALRTLWKLETPVTPPDTSKFQPSPSTPALTAGRTDNGLESHLVTPVVPQHGGLPQGHSGLVTDKTEDANFAVRDTTIGIVRVSDPSAGALSQIVTAKASLTLPVSKDQLTKNAPSALDMRIPISVDRDSLADVTRVAYPCVESRGETAESSASAEASDIGHPTGTNNDVFSGLTSETPDKSSPTSKHNAVANASVHTIGSSSLTSDAADFVNIVSGRLSPLNDDRLAYAPIAKQNGDITELPTSTTASGTVIGPVRNNAETTAFDHPANIDGEQPNQCQISPGSDAALDVLIGESTYPTEMRSPYIIDSKMVPSPDPEMSSTQEKLPSRHHESGQRAHPVSTIMPPRPEAIGSEAMNPSVMNVLDTALPPDAVDKNPEPHVASTPSSGSFVRLALPDTPVDGSDGVESHSSTFPQTVSEPDGQPSIPGDIPELLKQQTPTCKSGSNSSDPQTAPTHSSDVVRSGAVTSEPISGSSDQPTSEHVLDHLVESRIVTPPEAFPNSPRHPSPQAAAVDVPATAGPPAAAASNPISGSFDQIALRKVSDQISEAVGSPVVPSEAATNSFGQFEGIEPLAVTPSKSVQGLLDHPMTPNVPHDNSAPPDGPEVKSELIPDLPDPQQTPSDLIKPHALLEEPGLNCPIIPDIVAVSPQINAPQTTSISTNLVCNATPHHSPNDCRRTPPYRMLTDTLEESIPAGSPPPRSPELSFVHGVDAILAEMSTDGSSVREDTVCVALHSQSIRNTQTHLRNHRPAGHGVLPSMIPVCENPPPPPQVQSLIFCRRAR